MGIPSQEYDGYIANFLEMFWERSVESFRSWARRFIKKMGFTYRIRTKAQTKLRDDIIDYIKKYFVIMWNIINEKNLLNSKEK